MRCRSGTAPAERQLQPRNRDGLRLIPLTGGVDAGEERLEVGAVLEADGVVHRAAGAANRISSNRNPESETPPCTAAAKSVVDTQLEHVDDPRGPYVAARGYSGPTSSASAVECAEAENGCSQVGSRKGVARWTKQRTAGEH